MQKNMLLNTLIFSFCCISICCAVHRKDNEIFKKSRKQIVFPAINISDFKASIDDNFLKQFRLIYESHFSVLSKMTPFLQVLTNGQINEYGYQFKTPIDKQFVDKMVSIYEVLDNNLIGFVDFLKQSNFATAIVGVDDTTSSKNEISNKYKLFTQLLFAQCEGFCLEQILFSLANNCFDYCFNNTSFAHYQDLLSNAAYHPIARFLNSVMWQYLVNNGSKYWSEPCLDAIKERANNGCEVVYIAGGSDIYQLLRYGIYKIKVIDPGLPPQNKDAYEELTWLIKGSGDGNGIGDEILLSFDKRHIVMKRQSYHDGDVFLVKDSEGKPVEAKKSVTVWNLYDVQNALIGSVSIERRLLDQNDFADYAHKTYLLSFDEFGYALLPDLLSSWGIDLNQIPADLVFFVKQLKKSINKDALQNMKASLLMHASDLKFIPMIYGMNVS